TSLSPFPDLETLTAGLTSALQGDAGGRLTLVDRQPNPHGSTFPSEVVTCRLGGGETLRLFCKYRAGCDHQAHGHRGGVAYEAEVYQRVLRLAGGPAPRCYSVYADGTTGDVWLI